MLRILVAEVPALAEELIERFWPGPLTLVLPARRKCRSRFVNSTGGVGVRISSQPIATELVKDLGRPLTATSANPSGQSTGANRRASEKYILPAGSRSLSTAAHSLRKPAPRSPKSSATAIRIIRDGEISRSELRKLRWARKKSWHETFYVNSFAARPCMRTTAATAKSDTGRAKAEKPLKRSSLSRSMLWTAPRIRSSRAKKKPRPRSNKPTKNPNSAATGASARSL